ncbi:hypothetical protein KUW15_04225 [Qipengyuania aquimaris]|uniref:hypothetical protein n=1 Tax=Qipengyuania aquimaris TaxID=255984 RepID=UPI001C93B858|nr:hypothetical protein [Qipengyuania aquimaris]MBY6127915.1 hypothetical protein [Qipengyuania aquimaris]
MSARTVTAGKGRPLVFLLTLLAIWAGVRLVVWNTSPAPAGEPVPQLAASSAQVVASQASSNEPATAAIQNDENLNQATLVEGLDPVPSASEHSAYVSEAVAAGHDMLWMAASQGAVSGEGASGGI